MTKEDLLTLLTDIYDEADCFWPEFCLITSKNTRRRLKMAVGKHKGKKIKEGKNV